MALIDVIVSDITQETPTIKSIRLEKPDGSPLGTYLPGAHIGDDCDLRQRAVGAGDEFDQRRDHLQRQVVDDVPVHVLEGVGRRRTAGAGHSGQQQHLDVVAGAFDGSR